MTWCYQVSGSNKLTVCEGASLSRFPAPTALAQRTPERGSRPIAGSDKRSGELEREPSRRCPSEGF